jgi:uncharacterized protein YjdB/D-alanyl-D-alanine dipeptidase
MKKFFALFLALIMVFGLVSVPKATEAADEYSVTLQVTGPNDTVKTFNEDGETPQKSFAAGETVVLEAWTGNKGYKAKPIEIWINGDKTRNYAKELKEKQNIEYYLTFEMPAVDTTIEVVFEKWDAPADGYTLTVTQEGKGKYSVNPEKEYYALDDEVIISFTPEKGWTVEEVTVNGVPAAPGSGSEFKWAVQIKGDTEVHVKFVEESAPIEYKIALTTKNEQWAKTVDVPKSARAGATVDVTIVPIDQKKYGVRVTVTAENDEKITYSESGKFDFVMPASNVKVYAEFYEKGANEGHNVIVRIKNPEFGNAYAEPSENVVKNEGVTLYFEPQKGYKAEYTIKPEGLKTDGNCTFMMPDSDVTVDVEFVKDITPDVYQINLNVTHPEWGKPVDVPRSARAGATVDVTIVPIDQKQYGVRVTVTAESGATITYSESGKFDFVMPTSNVTIDVEFYEKIATLGHYVDIKVEGGNGGATVSVEPHQNKTTHIDNVPVDTEVKAHMSPLEGYVLDTVTMNGDDVKGRVESRYYEHAGAVRVSYTLDFNMPNENVDIRVTYRKIEERVYIDPNPIMVAVGSSVVFKVYYDRGDGLPVDLGFAQDENGESLFLLTTGIDSSMIDKRTNTITGVVPGEGYILASYTSPFTGDLLDSEACTVTVTEATPQLWIEPAEKTLRVGESQQLTVFYGAPDAMHGPVEDVTFTSSDPSKVIVSAQGLATAIGPDAVVTITAKYTANGIDYSAECVITVRVMPIPIGTLSLDKNAVNIAVGASDTLVATFENTDPHSIDNVSGSATWVSSDTSVVTVTQVRDHAEINAVGEGTAVITVVYSGHTATCTVTVTAAPQNDYDAFVRTLDGYFGDYNCLNWTILVKDEFADPQFSLTINGEARFEVTSQEAFDQNRYACWMKKGTPSASTEYPGYTQYVISVKLFAKQYNWQTAFTIQSGERTLRIRSYEYLAGGVQGNVDTSVSYSLVDYAALLARIYRELGNSAVSEKWGTLARTMGDFSNALNAAIPS